MTTVPDRRDYYPQMGAWMATGSEARVMADLARGAVAIDIETAGLGPDAFTIKCLTAAWFGPDGTVEAVLLDPRRAEDQHSIHIILDQASQLVLHNSPYDMPPMYHHGLISLAAMDKVVDTLVLARMAYPDVTKPKGLESLAPLAGIEVSDVSMADVFRAAGYAKAADGWREMDIDTPVYRHGAMADTIATLRLAGPLWDAAVDQLRREDYPDADHGGDRPRRILTEGQAHDLVDREQEVNRVMLRRSAEGLAVDTDYLARYRETHADEMEGYAKPLAGAGVDPEAGNVGLLLVEAMDRAGDLPASWPRTKTGKLSATRGDLKALAGHPLVDAQQALTETRKVLGYLDKVAAMAAITGRCHPQVSILGASATGRMSYSDPELQQFPADARPILVPDEGEEWTSLDWKQIEPVVAALMARDEAFLGPFESGADLYAPVQEAAGIDRKAAKVVVLALMYGMGLEALATSLGVTEDEALKIQRGVIRGMPKTADFLGLARSTAEKCGLATSAAGRMLDVPKDPKTGVVFSSKASNYIVQSSAYDVLAEAIVGTETAGLGGAIQLALHDELVVTTEHAERIKAIMETPPGWLTDWAGRTPTIRVDENPMGGSWKYV